MAEAAQQLKPSLKPLQLLVVGKIEQVRDYNGSQYLLVKTPAADEYSHPSTIEVRTTKTGHQEGGTVQMVCELGGSPNNFRTKNGVDVKSANLWLNEVTK